MKTSATQFEMLVTFMEQHGDLNKPLGSSMGKLKSMQKWEELMSLLNSEPSGETKSVEKWKKVWSDLKNNTKKKAARIHRTAIGTGGGPALQAKLSDLEQKVLNIIGPSAATGLDVSEAGFSQEPSALVHHSASQSEPAPDYEMGTIKIDSVTSLANLPENQPTDNEPGMFEQSLEEWNAPGPSREHTNTPVEIQIVVDSADDVPAVQGQTPRRPRSLSGRVRKSPRRRPRPMSLVDKTSQHFLHSDEEWRKFLKENELEKLRLRAMEVQVQQQWQEIVRKALELLQKFLEKK